MSENVPEPVERNAMRDKYKLTRKENIFLAKKFLVDTIYCGMQMEGRGITFPETHTILNGINVPNATIDDIQAVLNMRDACRLLLSTLDATLNADYICKLNENVSRNESLQWGVLRNGNVGISGTDYIPTIPEKENVEDYIKKLLNQDISITEKSIIYFLWGARSQLFWDGNKRTSLLAANQIMIKNGAGILFIPQNHMNEFTTLLTDFYNTNKYEQIKEFLLDTSIKGMDMHCSNKNIIHEP